MHPLLALTAIAVAPIDTQPSRRVWIVVDSSEHSTILQSEWRRNWKLRRLRGDLENDFVIKWLDVIETDRTPSHVPCVIFDSEMVPLTSHGSSGAAIFELHDVLAGFRVEREKPSYWEYEEIGIPVEPDDVEPMP